MVRGLLTGAAVAPGSVHPRNDPCLAGAGARPLLPRADAPSLLPLRLSDDRGPAVWALRAGAAGGNGHPLLPSRVGEGRRSVNGSQFPAVQQSCYRNATVLGRSVTPP